MIFFPLFRRPKRKKMKKEGWPRKKKSKKKSHNSKKREREEGAATPPCSLLFLSSLFSNSFSSRMIEDATLEPLRQRGYELGGFLGSGAFSEVTKRREEEEVVEFFPPRFAVG